MVTNLDKQRANLQQGEERIDSQQKPTALSGSGGLNHPQKVGARLHYYMRNWAAIGRAYLIKNGLQPEWKDKPPKPNEERKGRKCYTGVMHVNFVQQLRDELEERIIVRVNREDCKFISPTFLVPKKGGEWRKVVDCRELNKYIRDQTFIMEDHRTLRMLIEKGDFATSIDIRKAYHHVPVAEELQPYLAFGYAGHYYQYRGMPFGIKNAPRVFTHIMKAAMRAVRERWHVTSVQYLDDLLFIDKDASVLQSKTKEIATFLQNLGWCINSDKSNMIPTQTFVFLGVQWDTVQMTLKIDRKRNQSLQRQIKQWIRWSARGRRLHVRQVAKLIGVLSQTRIQFPRASLYLAKLNKLKTQAVIRQGWNEKLTLTPWVLNELIWWKTQLKLDKPMLIRSSGETVTLYTDASPQGWGGWLEKAEANSQPQWVVHAKWKESQQHSSNYHEALAVYLALKHFIQIKQVRRGQAIQLRTDNTTVMYNVNKQRGALTLLHPLKLIMELLETHEMQMQASHIPGILNTAADSLSRLARSGDYSLDQKIFNQGLKHLKAGVNIDLFASKTNKKCRAYVTLQNDAKASARDAFSMEWGAFSPLIHPPIPLLLRCLRKVKEERVRGVMVAPAWCGQPWSHLLNELTIRQVNLGKASVILTPGPNMNQNGLLLPPGTIIMCLVDGGTK
jgi:ribonuclease HI